MDSKIFNKLKKTKMKIIKYILYGLGIILALSNIGGMIQGFGSPILWILMIVFFIGGAAINTEKKD